MRWLAILLAAGCASAGSDQPGVDASGGGGGSDSGGGGGSDSGMEMVDGMVTMPDASGPMTRTLSQTGANNLTAGNTLACSNNTTGYTRANTFYRVFDLPAAGITTPFTVSQVSFQVEHCHNVNNTGCVVAVRVGTYTATPGASLNTANMVISQSNANVTIPEIIESGTPPVTPGGTVNAPITATIPANSKLLVVLDAPDGNNVYSFYPGTNNGTETAPGYIMSSTCGITAPLDMSGTLNGATTAAPRRILLTVTGTY